MLSLERQAGKEMVALSPHLPAAGQLPAVPCLSLLEGNGKKKEETGENALSRCSAEPSSFCTRPASHPANMIPKAHAGLAKKKLMGYWCCNGPGSLEV